VGREPDKTLITGQQHSFWTGKFHRTKVSCVMNIFESIILPAVEEYNQTFGPSSQVHKSREALLSGQGGPLDSLELVNFVVVVERQIHAATGKEFRLVTEEALSMKDSPFLTLGSLERFIENTIGTSGK
jgi:hypothetical protein